jgi:hypothetical protein
MGGSGPVAWQAHRGNGNMNPVLFCLGSFILMSFLSTLLFVAASMNSSRISQVEEGYEPEPAFHGHPIPARSES